jgi:hypothetical protein
MVILIFILTTLVLILVLANEPASEMLFDLVGSLFNIVLLLAVLLYWIVFLLLIYLLTVP